MRDQQPLPQIDSRRCTGCELCVKVCPTGALAMSEGKAYLRDPTACNYCMACEEVCPEDAIALPFLVIFAEPQNKPKSFET